MLDVAFQYQKILKSFPRFENRDISVSMERLGLKYKVNYGVSIPEIDKMAKELEPDNTLAIYLWNQDVRESKLLGIRIFDTNKLNSNHIEILIAGLVNIELAEQTAMHFFVKLADFFDIAQKLIGHQNKFCRLAAFLTIARFARMKEETISNTAFESILDIIAFEKLNDNEIFFKRALAAMLFAIGLRNEILNQKVIQWIDRKGNRNNEYKNWFEKEVKDYLLIKN